MTKYKKTKVKTLRKKHKIDPKELSSLLLSVLKYAAIAFISMIIYIGLKIYSELIDVSSFQSWTFLGMQVLVLIFLISALITWKFYGSLWFPVLTVVVGGVGNLPVLFRVSSWMLAFFVIFEILVICGLEIGFKIKLKPRIRFMVKLNWRGKKIW